MTLRDELQEFVGTTFTTSWSVRDGTKVPTTDNLKLSNDAVRLDATVLYADLAESTDMVNRYNDWFAASVYKAYLYCAAKMIRHHGGEITAYDGDRVMGVFTGDAKNSSAAKCALRINWAATELVQKKIDARWPDGSYALKQKVGIDTSQLFVARTGIRGNNDLVWVGRAANYAAKLAAKSAAYSAYITADVFSVLNDESKKAEDGRSMWVDLGTSDLGIRVYGSNWWWSV